MWAVFMGIKHSTSALVQIKKLLKFAANSLVFLAFLAFCSKMMEEHILPVFGVRSTQMLVKIYNKYAPGTCVTQ